MRVKFVQIKFLKKVDRQIQYAIRIFVYLRVVLGRDSDKPYTEGTQDINRITIYYNFSSTYTGLSYVVYVVTYLILLMSVHFIIVFSIFFFHIFS